MYNHCTLLFLINLHPIIPGDDGLHSDVTPVFMITIKCVLYGLDEFTVCMCVCVYSLRVSGDPSRLPAVSSQGGEVLDLPQSCKLLIGSTSHHTGPHISSSNWIAACQHLICIRPPPPPHLRHSAADYLARGFPTQPK